MTHVAIRTRDMTASIDFYQRYAELELAHERVDAGIRVAWLSDQPERPEFALVLIELPHEPMAEPSATDHFGFAVASRTDVDRIADLAEREGRLKLSARDLGPIVGYITLVRDPSGNTCEFSYGQQLGPHTEPPARASDSGH